MPAQQPVVVINALSARQGGGQTYIKNILGLLPSDRQLSVYVYAPESLSLPADPRIHRCKPHWATENPLLRTVWEIFILPSILKELSANILFCPGGIVTSKVPKGCKTVTMFRNMLPFDTLALKRLPLGLQLLRNLILRRVMLKSMNSADLTIFISDYARQVIEKKIKVKRALTIPHGVNAAFRTHSENVYRPDWLPSGEYILYVSKFDVYKHQMEVAEAYSSLPAHLKIRFKLIFVGEANNEMSCAVEDLARRCGLSEQIIVTGAIPYAELPAAYHFAAINIFASSCENCPNILLEAFGAGRPVLTSDVMPMPEFAGDAAEYFKPDSPSSIACAMIAVLDDDELRSSLAERARVRSVAFDWGRSAAKTWHAILELAAS